MSRTPEEIILAELQVSAEECIKIEQETVGQQDNILWWRAHKGRITGGSCKDYCGSGNPTNKVKRALTVGKPGQRPKSEHIKYGNDHEDTAVSMFEAQLSAAGKPHSLRKCGIFISKESGQLAASPDRVGLIDGENVVVEVKCLSASRTYTPMEAVEKKEKESAFAFRIVNNAICMKERHKWHYQVQMEMAMTGNSVAYLVIFTHVDFPVYWIKIQYDSDFWKRVQSKLLDFHEEWILPAVVAECFGSK